MTIQFSGQKTGVKAMTRTPCEPSLAAFLIAAAEGCVRCSSCRACEAAFGCEAVVNPADAVCLTYRNLRFYDCFAAERSLRQLLQVLHWGGFINMGGMRPTFDCQRMCPPSRRGILPRLFSVAPACPACLERCLQPTDAPKLQAPY